MELLLDRSLHRPVSESEYIFLLFILQMIMRGPVSHHTGQFTQCSVGVCVSHFTVQFIQASVGVSVSHLTVQFTQCSVGVSVSHLTVQFIQASVGVSVP